MTINQGLMQHYVRRINQPDPYNFYGPYARLAAIRYVEAEKAYELRNYRVYNPNTRRPDEEVVTLGKALGRLWSIKCGRLSVFHGVRRSELPSDKVGIGEYVRVRYWFMGERCAIGGFVERVVHESTGKALIIRLRDSWNSFNPDSWLYVVLWMPKDGSMAGFA